MTFKAAIPRLPLGGGKMVLLKQKQIEDRERYFKAVGNFIENLNGRYITTVDSGNTRSRYGYYRKQHRLCDKYK